MVLEGDEITRRAERREKILTQWNTSAAGEKEEVEPARRVKRYYLSGKTTETVAVVK